MLHSNFGGWITLNTLGRWPTLSGLVFERVGHSSLRLAFAKAVQPTPATVRPSILPIPCKTLNKLIPACYPAPVFAELHQRLDHEPALPPLNLFSVRLIQTICFQTVTHSSARRETSIPFSFNHFRTLFIVTEGIPHSSHSGTRPPPVITLILLPSFHALTKCKFCNPFVLMVFHLMGGWGVLMGGWGVLWF